MTEFPERINAMRVITFDVPEVIDSMKSLGYGTDPDYPELTLDVLLDFVHDIAADEIGDSYDLILQDENGNDL